MTQRCASLRDDIVKGLAWRSPVVKSLKCHDCPSAGVEKESLIQKGTDVHLTNVPPASGPNQIQRIQK
eukprot:3238484-Amphidinium_carterae.1